MATTFDSKVTNDTIIVEYNGRKMGIRKFLETARKDYNANKILACIKKHKDYEGSIIDFIKRYLKSDDRLIDIVLKSNGSYYFDESEIKRNKYKENKAPSCRIFKKEMPKKDLNKWNGVVKKQNASEPQIASRILRRD